MIRAAIATNHHSPFLDIAKAFVLLPVSLTLVVYLAFRERW